MYITSDPLHIPTRKLRASLAAHLGQHKAFSIGTEKQLRAIVVPTPNFRSWDPADQRRRFAQAKRAFAERLRTLRKLCNL